MIRRIAGWSHTLPNGLNINFSVNRIERANQQPEHQVSDDLPDGDDPHLVNVLTSHSTQITPGAH